jgi:hypothetical protein
VCVCVCVCVLMAGGGVVRVGNGGVLETYKQIMNSESVRIVKFVVSRLVNVYILVQQL